jgi:hypothetical protein
MFVVIIDNVKSVALALLLGVVALLAPPAVAAAQERLTLSPVADVSLPFWCDWGYDWDERCYRDDAERLPIGGETDKLWRAALRFPEPSGDLLGAELRLFFDGTCLAPRKTFVRCDGRAYVVDARAILSTDWFAEREVDVGPDLVATAEIPAFARPQWLTWDLTDLVPVWAADPPARADVLLQLSAEQEGFDVGGPALRSSAFPDDATQPRLDVWRYVSGP